MKNILITIGLVISSIVIVIAMCWGLSLALDPQPMSIEKMVEKIKQCEKAGLQPVEKINGWNFSIQDVECRIKN